MVPENKLSSCPCIAPSSMDEAVLPVSKGASCSSVNGEVIMTY
jgi:hypothetical protein